MYGFDDYTRFKHVMAYAGWHNCDSWSLSRADRG